MIFEGYLPMIDVFDQTGTNNVVTISRVACQNCLSAKFSHFEFLVSKYCTCQTLQVCTILFSKCLIFKEIFTKDKTDYQSTHHFRPAKSAYI